MYLITLIKTIVLVILGGCMVEAAQSYVITPQGDKETNRWYRRRNLTATDIYIRCKN